MVEASSKANDRGRLELNAEECKGCGLCVEACPPKVLRLAAYLNRYGYHPVSYVGEGCSGCGICFFACPEPGAIAVWRERVVRRPLATAA